MFIDAHHHLWDLQNVNYPWLNAKGVPRFFGNPAPIQRNYLLQDHQNNACQYQFVGSVHVQVGAEDPWQEALWVDQITNKNPSWPMVQVAYADLISPNLSAQLDQLQTLPSLRGVRQIVGRALGENQQTGTQQLLNNPAFTQGLGILAERGLSFDLQLIPELIAPTAEILHNHPHLKVALCHAGSPHDRSEAGLHHWQTQLQYLAALPNVYCKLSGLGMFQHHWKIKDFKPIINTCLQTFGAQRCMFGSNFPVDSLYSDFATLFEAYQNILPQQYHAQVFAHTAREFYGL